MNNSYVKISLTTIIVFLLTYYVVKYLGADLIKDKDIFLIITSICALICIFNSISHGIYTIKEKGLIEKHIYTAIAIYALSCGCAFAVAITISVVTALIYLVIATITTSLLTLHLRLTELPASKTNYKIIVKKGFLQFIILNVVILMALMLI